MERIAYRDSGNRQMEKQNGKTKKRLMSGKKEMNNGEEMMDLVGIVRIEPIGAYLKAITCAFGKLQTIADSLDWISVEDKLPKTKKSKLPDYVDVWVRGKHTTLPYGRITNIQYDEVHGWCTLDTNGLHLIKDVTHWKPLPKPPK